jgi:hypothetical protein
LRKEKEKEMEALCGASETGRRRGIQRDCYRKDRKDVKENSERG